MPTYVYKCSECGHVEEHFHKMSEVKTLCSKCFAHALEKQLSAPAGFKFNGGGYYCTDFKGK